VVVLATGAKNKETGVSWCPDCTAAEPHLEAKLGTRKHNGPTSCFSCPGFFLAGLMPANVAVAVTAVAADACVFVVCAVERPDFAAWREAMPGGTHARTHARTFLV